MSDVSINAIIAARLLKTGVRVLELGVAHETQPDLEGGIVRHLGTGVSTLTIKIYDPAHDEVK